ncbi:L-idonate 5-dehydrogenase [Demequina capsici]|uniref:L-idonate 5-dehydrogenase n=1 Tax=Demequina capsici TaxID=3075620 RepID=A0AA96F469_9MICO|nr:L-idonate 5-dehydrogenase [Demequina sp. OYTSA14]WNM23602.1 L-idonate 5-dehydrogenase [Demequina sp. OYTSA14]
MRAIVVHGPRDVRVEQRDEPDLSPGDVRIRAAYVGICGSDLSYYRHGAVGDFTLREPLVIGHEVSGTVVETASDVTTPVGSRVTVHPATPGESKPGIEDRPNIWPNSRYLGSAATWPHTQGAASTTFVVRADQVRPLPDDLPLDRAALAEPLAVAVHAVRRAGDLTGASVLVSGAGPIGQMAIAAALDAGAREVAVADVLREPLALARKLGASYGFVVGEDSLPAEEFDVVLECSGAPAALDQAIRSARRGGVVVQIGMLPGEPRPYTLSVLCQREIDLRGSFRFDGELDHAVEILAHTPALSAAITALYTPDHAEEAFALAADPRQSCKVLIDLTGEA